MNYTRISLLPENENKPTDSTIGKPFFSIIVAVLNGEKTLEKCIESVDNQSFPNKELIIFDGGSTDGTVEILENKEEKIAYWESKTDRGIYHAFNRAIGHAKGDWIYFLGSDDTFCSPEVLKNIHVNIKKLPPWAKLVYGSVVHCANDGSRIGVSVKYSERKIHSLRMPIDHQAVFHHRTLFEKYGLFDENFKMISDLDHQLRILFTNAIKPYFLPVAVAFHTHGGVSTRLQNRLTIWKEVERIGRKLGISIPFHRRIYRLASAFFWVGLAQIVEDDSGRKFDNRLLQLEKKHPWWRLSFLNSHGSRNK